MECLNALYFPDTRPQPAVIGGLSLLCTTVFHYLPSERVGPDTTATTPGTHPESFFESHGLCRAYAPAPLGNDRERFIRVIKELQAPDSTDGNRLTSLSLAALSSRLGQDQDEASVGSLRSAFIGRRNGSTGTISLPHEEREALWQARLVLTLGEAMDRAEQEVMQGLSSLADQERTLFMSLRGDTDRDALEAAVKRPPKRDNLLGRPSPEPPPEAAHRLRHLRHRLHAWVTLFLQDSMTGEGLAPSLLLATGHPEAAALVFDACKQLTTTPPFPLVSLAMPPLSATMPGKTFLAQRLAFLEETRASHQTLIARLGECVAGAVVDSGKDATADATETWNHAVFNRWGATGNTALTIYCLPGVPLPRACRAIQQQHTKNHRFDTLRNGLMAVLAPPSQHHFNIP